MEIKVGCIYYDPEYCDVVQVTGYSEGQKRLSLSIIDEGQGWEIYNSNDRTYLVECFLEQYIYDKKRNTKLWKILNLSK